MPVDLALTWAPASPLRAPDWAGGIVQSILVKPGDDVRDGTEILRISGVLVVAVRSEEPFYRPILLGDRGSDVRELNSFLARNGYAAVDGEVASSRTSAGIRAFSKRIGLPATSVFDPTWVIQLPEEIFHVLSVEIDQGAAAPTLGQPIATAANKLSSATVVPAGFFASNSQPDQTALDPQEILRQAIEVPEGQGLWLGEDELVLNERRSGIDETDLSDLASSVPTNALSIQANQIRSVVSGDWLVPSAAVFASDTGHACVRVESKDRAIRVVIVADSGGSSVIRGAIDPGDRVEVRVMGSRRQCS